MENTSSRLQLFLPFSLLYLFALPSLSFLAFGSYPPLVLPFRNTFISVFSNIQPHFPQRFCSFFSDTLSHFLRHFAPLSLPPRPFSLSLNRRIYSSFKLDSLCRPPVPASLFSAVALPFVPIFTPLIRLSSLLSQRLPRCPHPTANVSILCLHHLWRFCPYTFFVLPAQDKPPILSLSPINPQFPART